MTARTKVDGTYKVALGTKAFVENKRYNMPQLCEVGDENEKWCLRANEVVVLKIAEIAMCFVKLIDKRTAKN